jgi:phosphatidylglycerol:prolipoprotein diacylglycerol transferase
MRQVLFRIPGVNLPLYGFGIMIVVGFYLGLLLAVRRSKRQNLDPNVIYDLVIWLLIGGIVGARLFYVVEYWDQIETFTDIFKIWEGGIVFYGSVIGATVGFFLARMVRPFPILATLDVLAPSIALGIAFGRVGCFLNGCCYGDVCPFRWLAVHFPPNSPAWNAERARGLIPVDAPTSLPLHPTQLYAAIDGLVLLVLLTAYFPLRRRAGEVIALLMLTYPITRFLIERLRDDEPAFIWGLTISQAISLGLLLSGLILWVCLPRQPISAREPEKPVPSV